MDLRTIAQSGVDPKTGQYLSKEERIAAFKRGMSRKPSSAIVKRNVDSDDGGKGGALIKMQEMSIIKELRLTTKSANKLFKLRSERVRLEEKFVSTQKKVEERKKKQEEEKQMEAKKPSGGKNIFKKFIDKNVEKASLDLFGLLGSIAAYGILDWMSKPENKNQVELMVRIFSGLFKLFDFFVGFAVDRTMGGFFKLFGGSSILERIFGFFELAFGIFLFKGFLSRVYNPFKLIGDIKWIYKNAGKFVDLFKALSAKNLGKAFDTLKSIFPKTLSIFKQSFGRSVKRLMLRIFGKGITKLIGPLFKQATKFLLKPLAQGAKRIPIIGGLIAVPINMFLGDPVDKAIFKAAGSTLGAIAAGALGSIIPGAGTILGATAGGLLGDFLGGFLYDRIVPGLKGIFGKKQPELNTGGVASGPETGYQVTLHGTEAVIPVKKFAEVALSPYKLVGSVVIGATMAVLRSMGPIGQLLTPVATQLFSPYIKLFGISTQTFSSGIGKQSDSGGMFISDSSVSEYEEGEIEEFEPQKGGGGRRKPSGKDKPDPVPTGPVPQGKSADFWTLAAVASREDGDPQGQADVAQSIYNRLASGAYGGKTIKDLIISTWQYEPTWRYPNGPTRGDGKPNPQWLNISDIKSAAAAVGASENHVAAAAKAITNSSLQAKAAEFVQGRTDFTGYSKSARRGQIQRKRGDNYFGWDFNYSGKGVAKVPSFSGVKLASAGGEIPLYQSGGKLMNDTGFHRRERSQVLVAQFNKAKSIKDETLQEYAAGGSHRVVPDTPSTSWAAGIPLTYVTTKEGKRAEVALPLAKRFQGFIKELQATGYKISEFGGFRPDGPPAGNVDGKGPMYAHPYGAAVDINWTRNPAFRKAGNDFPSNVGQIASKYGLGWGVKFDDAMHFSAMKREYGAGIAGQEINKKSLMGSKDGGDYTPESPSSSTPSSPDTPEDQKKQEEEKSFELSGSHIDMIRDLYKLLNPGSNPDAPSTAKAPEPKPQPKPPVTSSSPSKLPEMSKLFSLDNKMKSLVPTTQPTQIFVNAPTNVVGTAFSGDSLNSNSISEINNLNKI